MSNNIDVKTLLLIDVMTRQTLEIYLWKSSPSWGSFYGKKFLPIIPTDRKLLQRTAYYVLRL